MILWVEDTWSLHNSSSLYLMLLNNIWDGFNTFIFFIENINFLVKIKFVFLQGPSGPAMIKIRMGKYLSINFLLSMSGFLPCKSCQMIPWILHFFCKYFRNLYISLELSSGIQHHVPFFQIGKLYSDSKRTLSWFILNSVGFLNVDVLRHKLFRIIWLFHWIPSTPMFLQWNV